MRSKSERCPIGVFRAICYFVEQFIHLAGSLDRIAR